MVNANLVKKPEEYAWSNCRATVGSSGDGPARHHEWHDDKDHKKYKQFS